MKNTKLGMAVAGIVGVAGLGSAALFGAPTEAHACGGLFCDRPPPDPFAPLPVAQTGENVVFAIDKDPAGGATTLTAHIQILYAGDAALFSWVVPVDAPPDIGVGTDRLFSTLAGLTQPQFSAQTIVDGQCIPTAGNRDAMDAGPGGFAPPSVAGTGGAAGAAGGVIVSFMGAVGPYEASVIKSDDPMRLKMWLTDNGYTVSDQAAGLIDDYVRAGKYFVALKLQNGVGVKAIQPVVLTFKGIEPCVPLRLTAIAANPDMQVRMWILADRRAVPKNFLEFKVDEARIDWVGGGSNYNALVTAAANEAGGNAFVTEYAGAASIAARALWTEGQYNLTALQAAMTPPAYVQALVGMGLANDSQTLVLLAKHIPMPAAVKAMGISDSAFYGNLAFYWAQYTFPPFNLQMLTADIVSTIIEPRHTAQTMIDAHPYLTRLNTFISPEEMNVDPLFIINRDLPDVSLVHRATFRIICGNAQFMACNAPVRLELADGRTTWVRTGSTATTCAYRPFDLGRLQGLPAADIAWQREEVGEGTRTLDNTTVIQAGLMLNNSAFPAEQRMFPIPSPDPPASGPGVVSTRGGGCACAMESAAGSMTLGALLAAVGLTVLLVRRRRGRRSAVPGRDDR
jgi:MYXO-CTERM domain-containing protein